MMQGFHSGFNIDYRHSNISLLGIPLEVKYYGRLEEH